MHAADAMCERNTNGKIRPSKPARKLHQATSIASVQGKRPGL